MGLTKRSDLHWQKSIDFKRQYVSDDLRFSPKMNDLEIDELFEEIQREEQIHEWGACEFEEGENQ
jgi:hypothetical protein